MKKLLKVSAVLFSVLFIVLSVGLIRDKLYLKNSLVRLHVVANSNSETDQQLKLQVRDRILAFLEDSMGDITTKADAMEYLGTHLQDIEEIARSVVCRNDKRYPISVTLQKEDFSTRNYETFSLPAGCYDALRINIGEAVGKNWWCVTFPNLCLPATGETIVDVAADAGFSQSLTKTLQGKGEYRLRFYLLERLGVLENLFFN